MGKYYFIEDNDEFCYAIDAIMEQMKQDEVNEQIVIEAKRVTDTVYFFCKKFNEVGDVGQSCGNVCPEYIPNNGKNGRCKHYGYLYEKTDKKITLKI